MLIEIYRQLATLPFGQIAPLLEAIAEIPTLTEFEDKEATPEIFIPH